MLLTSFYTIHSFEEIIPTYRLTPENVTAEIVALYKEAANSDYIGEAISQLDHALQTGLQAVLAFDKSQGINKENIIAAFLHDIGHRYTGSNVEYMDKFGIKNHDKIGAAFLKARGFSDKVVTLVGGHVQAKRYKVYKNMAYHDKLTFASQQTLTFQGGAMTKEEATAFEQTPYAEQVVLLRTWEEKAKVPNTKTPSLSYFASLILEHLENNLVRK
ncbi:HDIG domain-containing protein [bacterium]|nr:HDIG domain-containing protein [bacterium]